MEAFPTSELLCKSPEDTEVLGRRIAGFLTAGSVLALYGGLGSGKTCLARGVARGLGVAEAVTSPTYTIVGEYLATVGGRELPLYHIDAYRLRDEDDFEEIGAGELLGGEGIAIVEWSERVPGLIPEDAIRVSLEPAGERGRLVRVSGPALL
ncbi:MAG: tRNA (adenosine(37)-N6)-threonylcarbamoyltransferase complex ATPase subunit type 1 TsaE [Treponema sp.]|nr:tRNA (adenosine(37)-N6)-threonylcarbamoyltransferase complex ATPase subunit type 1 TsaE [Treponema sp.]